MNSIKISFILPCFNVEKYIGACLDTLFRQDIPMEDYEIICVNDCSTDKTKSLIESYAEKHPNLCLINHTVNKTAGGARNTGLEHAQGKYVWFVDPDDFIKPNVLKELLTKCEKNNLDELLFNFDAVDQNLEKIIVNHSFFESELTDGINFVEKYFENDLSKLTIVWQEIYRLDFIINNSIRFPEIRVGEDVPFAWKTLLNSKRIMSIEDAPYIYRDNTDSITAKNKKDIDGEVLFSKTILFGYEIIKLSNSFKSYSDIVIEFQNTVKWAVNNIAIELSKANNQEIEKFRKYCIDNSDKISVVFHYLNSKNRFLLRISKMGVFLFRNTVVMIKILHKLK